jgi:hypothetical protein
LLTFKESQAGGPVIRITVSYEKLCPVHRSFFAMSGRVAQVPIIEFWVAHISLLRHGRRGNIDGGGGVLDEVNGATWKRSEVNLGGKHLATVNPYGVTFVHSDWLGTEAGGPVIRITVSYEKLCPAYRSFFAMSRRVAQAGWAGWPMSGFSEMGDLGTGPSFYRRSSSRPAF